MTTDEFLHTARAATLIPFLQALHEAERQLTRQPDEMTELFSKQLEQPKENINYQLSEAQLRLSMDSQLPFDLETIALWLQIM